MIKEIVHGLRVLYSQFIGSQNAKFAYKHPSAKVNPPCIICGAENISLEENVSIGPDSIMFAPLTKLRIKKISFTGPRVFFSTGNHYSKLGKFMAFTTDEDKKNDGVKLNHDVLVEEDVWIGANVSVLCEHIGRGAICACGAVLKHDVPPYSVVGGVPARVLKFRFTVEEILEHEQQLYAPEERISEEKLREIFNKYQP